MATSLPYDWWVEWAPAYGINDDVPDPAGWQRINLGIRQWSLGHGVQRELGRLEAGEFEVVMGDPARDFDPWNRSGPNWAALQSRHPVRLRAQATSISAPVDLLRGWTKDWVPDWYVTDVWVVLTGVDVAGALNKVIKGTVFDRYAAALGADIWLPLDEGGGDTAYPLLGPMGHNTRTSPGGNLMPFGDQPSVSYPEVGCRTDLLLPGGVIAPPSSGTVGVVCKGGSATDTQVVFAAGSYDPATVKYGDVVLMFNDPSFATPNTVLSIGSPAGRDRLLVSGALNTVPTLYLCGWTPSLFFIEQISATTNIGNSTARSGIAGTPRAGGIRLGNTMDPALDHPMTGELCNFLYMSSLITSTPHSNLILSYAAPLADRRSDAQIDWILDDLGIPAGRRNLETGRQLMGSLRLGAPARDILERIAATEGGRFFARKDGVFTFYNRDHVGTARGIYDTRPPAGSGNASLADLTPTADERTFSTVARMQVATPSPIEVEYRHPNADIIGEVVSAPSTAFRTPTEALGRAQGLVGNGTPRLDVVGAKIIGGAPGVDWADLLALDVSDRVGIVGRIPSIWDAPDGTYFTWDSGAGWDVAPWAGPGPIERTGKVLRVGHTADGAEKRWETTVDLEGV